MSADRSQLSLPLQDTSSGDQGRCTFQRSQPKLIKSFSTPANYSTSLPLDAQFIFSNSSTSSQESKGHPPLSRTQSIRETISNGTAKFFGVPPVDDGQSPTVSTVVDPKWNCRRLRYISKRYGNLKEEAVVRELGPQPLDDVIDVLSLSKSVTPVEESLGTFPSSGLDGVYSRSRSVDSRSSRITQKLLERRESVVKMAYDKLSAVVQKGTFRATKVGCGVKRGRSTSSSFSPFSIQQTGNVTHIKITPAPVNASVLNAKSMSTVTEADDENSRDESKLEAKTNEFEKREVEENDVVEIKKGRPAIHFQSEVEVHSMDKDIVTIQSVDVASDYPSVSPTAIAAHKQLDEKTSLPLSITSMESLQDEVFFDVTPVTVSSSNFFDAEQGDSSLWQRVFGIRNGRFPTASKLEECIDVHPIVPEINVQRRDHRKNLLKNTGIQEKMVEGRNKMTEIDRPVVPEELESSTAEQVRHRNIRLQQLRRQESFDAGMQTPTGIEDVKSRSFSSLRHAISSPKEWLLQNVRAPGERERKQFPENMRNWHKKSLLDMIQEKWKSKKYYVPRRRQYGLGFGIWRKCVHRAYKKDAYQTNIDTYVDYRPFFTYWVTTVQILVTIISLCTYGIGPWGIGRTERTADVLHTTVTLKRVSIYVQQNIWLGPKFADLVHLGAKFTPCMRRDPRIFAQVNADREEENETGCCIYNDGTGCFQTGQLTCPSLIATLARWKEDSPGPNGRISGAVCGQDPRYCEDPVSVKPYDWPDDMTQWPICKHTTKLIPENEKHMQCEITGRPCCIQLHGQCRITTRDYCDFVEGYFHENATLCSQVSCLSEVCGMLPFLRKNQPDQWYRLFIPLFLHAGLLHCMWTVFIQIFYMRDLEKLLGWARIALLYMVSGIGGYLAGAIFVPYQPEVGPAGSHIGMFAAMYVDVVYSWNLLERPWNAVMQLGLFTLAILASGTLPWVDNWAHLFGFIFGFLISLAVLPYIQTKRRNRARRLLIVIASLSIALGLLIVLLAIFYWLPGIDCPYCEYFNCIPYTDHFCDNQGLRLKNWLPI